jgi:hypothetical protein
VFGGFGNSVALTRSGTCVVFAGVAPAIAAWAEPATKAGNAITASATAARVSHELFSREAMKEFLLIRVV